MQRLKKIIFSVAVIIFFLLAFIYKAKIAGKDPWAPESLKTTFLFIIIFVPVFIIVGYFIEKIKEKRKNSRGNA